MKDTQQNVEKTGYPPALLKATEDPFNYILKLKTGEVIVFQSAIAVTNDWVILEKIDYEASTIGQSRLFSKGLNVRVSEIVWCADGE